MENIEKEKNTEHINNLINQMYKSNLIDIGKISDTFHDFNELYDFRTLLNAMLFNEWSSQNKIKVYKSKRHANGELCFGSSEWFIVVAELPQGQISNHYHIKHWDLFNIKIEPKVPIEYDGHTSKDVLSRMSKFINKNYNRENSYKLCPYCKDVPGILKSVENVDGETIFWSCSHCSLGITNFEYKKLPTYREEFLGEDFDKELEEYYSQWDSDMC